MLPNTTGGGGLNNAADHNVQIGFAIRPTGVHDVALRQIPGH